MTKILMIKTSPTSFFKSFALVEVEVEVEVVVVVVDVVVNVVVSFAPSTVAVSTGYC